MAKTTAKTKNTQKAGKQTGPVVREGGILARHRRLVILLIIGVLGTAGIWGVLAYRNNENEARVQRAYEADKVQFAKVEADMEVARGAIIEAIGEPVREEKGKSCSRVALKFEEGELRCRVVTQLIYGVADRRALVDQFVSAKLALSTGKVFTVGSEYPLIDSEDSLAYHDSRSLTVWMSGYKRIACQLNALQINPRIENQFSYLEYPMGLNLIMSCYQAMERAIYPLAE